MTPKLDDTSKAIIRNIVGRCHISESNDSITKKVKSKLGKGWTKHPHHILLLEEIFKYAIKTHNDNFNLYVKVMS